MYVTYNKLIWNISVLQFRLFKHLLCPHWLCFYGFCCCCCCCLLFVCCWTRLANNLHAGWRSDGCRGRQWNWVISQLIWRPAAASAAATASHPASRLLFCCFLIRQIVDTNRKQSAKELPVAHATWRWTCIYFMLGASFKGATIFG